MGNNTLYILKILLTTLVIALVTTAILLLVRVFSSISIPIIYLFFPEILWVVVAILVIVTNKYHDPYKVSYPRVSNPVPDSYPIYQAEAVENQVVLYVDRGNIIHAKSNLPISVFIVDYDTQDEKVALELLNSHECLIGKDLKNHVDILDLF